CGRTIEAFWDALNRTTNKLDFASSFSVGELLLGLWEHPEKRSHEIEVREPGTSRQNLSLEQWRQLLQKWARAGWALMQTEFRQTRFDRDETGQPSRSHFSFSADLTNSIRAVRATVRGSLTVDWALVQTSNLRAADGSKSSTNQPGSSIESV